MITRIAILSVVLFANKASAEYLSFFPGNITCGKYLATDHQWTQLGYMSWINGFVSGANFATSTKRGDGKHRENFFRNI